MKQIYFHTPCLRQKVWKSFQTIHVCNWECWFTSETKVHQRVILALFQFGAQVLKKEYLGPPWQTLCGAQILRTLVAFLWVHIVAVEVSGARQDSWLKGCWKMSWKAKMGAKPKSRRSNRWNNIYLVKPSTLLESKVLNVVPLFDSIHTIEFSNYDIQGSPPLLNSICVPM